MASLMTNKGKTLLSDGTITWASATIKAMLLNANNATPDTNTVSEISADEISATGYTGGFGGAGRQTLDGKSATEDDTNDRVNFDATDETWSSIGGATNDTITAVAIIRENTNDADSDVLMVIELTSGVTTNGSDFTMQWGSPMFYLG